MRVYEVILHARAWDTLTATRGAEQRRLLAILDEIKAAPFRAGDFKQRDETGRFNEVVLLGEWLVTFWSDHTTREIRIVNLERVED